MNYEEKFAKLRGMVDEVACKTKIYIGIARDNPLRATEVQEKLRNLHTDLDRYQKELMEIRIFHND